MMGLPPSASSPIADNAQQQSLNALKEKAHDEMHVKFLEMETADDSEDSDYLEESDQEVENGSEAVDSECESDDSAEEEFVEQEVQQLVAEAEAFHKEIKFSELETSEHDDADEDYVANKHELDDLSFDEEIDEAEIKQLREEARSPPYVPVESAFATEDDEEDSDFLPSDSDSSQTDDEHDEAEENGSEIDETEVEGLVNEAALRGEIQLQDDEEEYFDAEEGSDDESDVEMEIQESEVPIDNEELNNLVAESDLHSGDLNSLTAHLSQLKLRHGKIVDRSLEIETAMEVVAQPAETEL